MFFNEFILDRNVSYQDTPINISAVSKVKAVKISIGESHVLVIGSKLTLFW